MKNLKTVFALSILCITMTGCFNAAQKNDVEKDNDVITQIDENTWVNQDGRVTNEAGVILSTSDNMNDSNQGL